jgi:hypothetical protein
MNEPEKPKKGWGARHVFGAFLCVALATGLILAYCVFRTTVEWVNQVGTTSNVVQIGTAMKIWAEDHRGFYPDSVFKEETPSANKVFRQLFRDGICEKDRFFGAPQSPYMADGEIGEEPDFIEAVKAGENHWMIIAGLNSRGRGYAPLIFENALSPTWPPRWRSDMANKPVCGRAWRDRKIIIYRNDGSAAPESLVQDGETLALPEEIRKVGEDELKNTPIKILDIEEKK